MAPPFEPSPRPLRIMKTPAATSEARMAAKATPTMMPMARNYPRRQYGAALREALVLVAAVACIGIAARLGVWQLDRAAQKVALQTSLDARAREPLLLASQLARDGSAAEGQHYRRVRIAGRWIADRTVYLDNRQMDGKVGFFVVTPLAIDGLREAVLVQRGWTARNFADRAALPSVGTPAGPVIVDGAVAPQLSRLYEFAGAASGPIRQNLDVGAVSRDLARDTGLELLPVAVLESDAAGNRGQGLSRHWLPPATDVQKHYGYAFQWFAIGTVIAFLYVWHRIVRPRSRARRSEA